MSTPGGMLKYFNDRGGPMHGGYLHWPGTGAGFPVRGDVVPDLRQEEFEELPHTFDFHSKLFRLGDPQDKQEFDQIQDRINNGWFSERRRIDRWDEELNYPLVWLEWIQVYGEVPPKVSNSYVSVP